MGDNKFPPPGTGEHISTGGEETAKANHEPGRTDLGKDANGRPIGGSTARMGTSINPQEAVDAESTKAPAGKG